jgi:hypothetical protein
MGWWQHDQAAPSGVTTTRRPTWQAYHTPGILPQIAGPLLAHNGTWWPLTARRQVDAVPPQREEPPCP